MDNLKSTEKIWTSIRLLIITVLIIIGFRFAMIVALFICLIDVLRRSISWKELGFIRPDNPLRIIIISVLIACAYQLISIKIFVPFLAAITGQPIDLQEIIALRGSMVNVFVAIALSWTFAAFGEEIVYRGYLYLLFRRIVSQKILGVAVGIAFCSILFSIGHGYQGITGAMENALFGVTLGMVFVLAKNNLWYPILIHGFVDTIGFCLILFGLYP